MKVPRNLPSSAQIRQMQTKMLRRMVYYYYYYYLLCGGMKLSMSWLHDYRRVDAFIFASSSVHTFASAGTPASSNFVDVQHWKSCCIEVVDWPITLPLNFMVPSAFWSQQIHKNIVRTFMAPTVISSHQSAYISYQKAYDSTCSH